MPAGKKSASSLARFSAWQDRTNRYLDPKFFEHKALCSLASVVFRLHCASCTGALVLHRELLHALPVFVRGGRNHLDENIEVGASVNVNVGTQLLPAASRFPGFGPEA